MEPNYDDILKPLFQTPEESVQPFTEAYYGKLPEFLELEKLFDIVIQKARKEGESKCNPNKYPEMEKIQNIFCKLFGFKKMYFYWYPSNVNNAFTVTLYSLMLFGESKDFIRKRDDKGFYDASHRSVLTVYGYTGLLSKKTGLTAQELIAITTHEIGHNFDYSLYHLIGFMMDFVNSFGLSALQTAFNRKIKDHNEIKMYYHNEVKKEGDALYNDEKQRKTQDKIYADQLKRVYNSGLITNILKFLVYSITFPIDLIIAIPIQLTTLDGKKGELFADSFATAYGYGSDLITGLEKISVYKGNLKKGKALSFFRNMNDLLLEMINGMTEIHGTNQERCKACIKKLRADLKKEDYPEGMKAELEKEIDRMEERYQMILNSPDAPKMVRRWRKLCDILFGGAFSIAKFFKANRV